MRLTVFVALFGLFSVLPGCATESAGPHLGDVTPDGLDRVDAYGVFAAFAKPAVRLDAYQRVHFEPGALRYRSGVRYPRGRRIPHPGPARTIELSVEDEARLWTYFQDVFGREFLHHSELAIAEGPGEGTLTVRAHILDLVVRQTGRSTGAESRFSRHPAVFTIVLDVRDSLTNEALARIIDRRGTTASNGLARQVGSALDTAGVRRQMHEWARRLRAHLDRLQG
jgi:hypothetical protein